MMVSHEISLLVSSDPSSGAKNISPDGSRFEVQLEDPIHIPKEALNITVDVEESTVWWVVPNIILNTNDKLYLNVPNVADVITAYIVTVPQGLYDLNGLNNAVLRELQNAGAKITPSPTITFGADAATQKVVLTLNYIGSSIDFTPNNTFRNILGFNPQIIGPTIIAPYSQIADITASFNQVNYFLIHSDLTSKGIRFNNNYNQTISQVLIDVAPGSQIVSKPFNPARISCPELADGSRKILRFWLTDDKNREINTNNEYWTARISLRYMMPHIMR